MIDLLTSPVNIEVPPHGGRLQQAVKNSHIPLEDWIDLSTGINPDAYPIPVIDQKHFHRLPESESQLHQAAMAYYLNHLPNNKKAQHPLNLLAIPGSQWFIQNFPQFISRWLPRTREHLNVLTPAIGFKEHAFWWQYHKHTITPYSDNELGGLLEKKLTADVVVIINPNNPTTLNTSSESILKAASLNPNTLFVVDEAFMDSTPHHSLLNYLLPKNIIVLRSLGKFFGLAGIRVGFVIGANTLIKKLNIELGPWAISTPSEYIATQALQDTGWQQSSIHHLRERKQQLLNIISAIKEKPTIGRTIDQVSTTNYFITLKFSTTKQAQQLYEALLNQGVLCRAIENTPLIRLGLPLANQLTDIEQRLSNAVKNR